MPIYEFKCEDCRLIFEKKASMKRAPKSAKCPECTKKVNRNFEAPPPVIFKGTDYRQNKAKFERFKRDGYTKDEAHRFYNESIKASKDCIQNFRYRRYDWTHEVANAMGGIRNSNPAKKIENCINMEAVVKNKLKRDKE